MTVNTTHQATSVANRMNELVEWLDSAPVFLKPERIQDRVVHRPRSFGEAGTFARWFEAFELIEAVVAFLSQLAGNAGDSNAD